MQCFTSPKAVGQWEPNIRPGKSPSHRWIVSRVSVRMGEREALAVFPHLSFWSAQTAEIAEKKRRDRRSCSFNSCSFEDSVKGKER